jgi:hypothetical protein
MALQAYRYTKVMEAERHVVSMLAMRGCRMGYNGDSSALPEHHDDSPVCVSASRERGQGRGPPRPGLPAVLDVTMCQSPPDR